MVLTGKTLSPIGHCQAAGEHATPRALCMVTAQPCRAAPV
jgi:hypothetical protein